MRGERGAWDHRAPLFFFRILGPLSGLCALPSLPSVLRISPRRAGNRSRRVFSVSAVRRFFHLRVIELPGLAPWPRPQSAYREDQGEHPNHAERVKRPDEQEGWTRSGNLAVKNASRSYHVEDGHAYRNDRADEHDDVPRPPFAEQQRSVQPDNQDGHRNEG